MAFNFKILLTVSSSLCLLLKEVSHFASHSSFVLIMGCASSKETNEEVFQGIHSVNPDHDLPAKVHTVDVNTDMSELSLLFNKAKNIIDADYKISNDDLSTTWNKIDTIVGKYVKNEVVNSSKNDDDNNKQLNESTKEEIKFAGTNNDNDSKLNDNLTFDLNDDTKTMSTNNDIIDKIITVSKTIRTMYTIRICQKKYDINAYT